MPELDEWESFYLIVGGAAGALIGLQFVVMTLIAERPPVRTAESSAAFGHPDDRPFQRRVASVGCAARAMANHHLSCSSLGSRGPGRSDVRCTRRPTHA